jgi:translation initiation factor IF-1
MRKDEKFTIKGKIIKHNPGGKFSVEIQTEKGPYIIKEAYISGKIKINNIRLVVGDDVLIEIDCHDFKGRILKRL